MGKHQAFTVPIRGNGKALELGAWCLMSETFLYLSGEIHLICRCLIGKVLRYVSQHHHTHTFNSGGNIGSCDGS